ncbi:MAG TPA: hypothetical protein VFZ08_16550 [Terriglobia bacterium]|nr:hypothetical protein [Terriglobia bacterium]
MTNVDATKIHQGPGSLWLGCAVPASGFRLLIDASGIPITDGLNPPVAPALSSVPGGSLSASTYYTVITYVNPLGETLPSPEGNLAVAAGNLLVVASPAAAGNATSYNVYASTVPGGEKLQNLAPLRLGQGWTQPATALITGGAPPVASSSGPRFAGAVSGATTIVWTPKIETLSADQVPAPIDARMTAEEQSLEAEMMETDYMKLRACIANGVFASGSDPGLPAGAQGYEEISFGGLMQVPRLSVAMVSPRTDAPAKFVVSQLYSAYQAQALTMAFSREKPTTVKVKFNGLADPSRPVGDQVGKIYRQP